MPKNDQIELISAREAARITSLSRTMVTRLRRIPGGFPPAVVLSEGRIAFVKSEVDAWIRKRIEARGDGSTES